MYDGYGIIDAQMMWHVGEALSNSGLPHTMMMITMNYVYFRILFKYSLDNKLDN